jgi:hypothetical protein
MPSDQSLDLSNENGEWEPLPDTDYYGEIPNEVNEEQLASIMVQGLFKYAQDLKTHGTTFDNLDEALEDMASTLDCWCEHDSLCYNKFSHLINGDDNGQFFDQVLEQLSPLLEAHI